MMAMRLTLRHLFVILLFLSLFAMALYPIADPDFWWHLRTGQFIVQTHAIPGTDPFSYTQFGLPWVTHEWLSEVIIYALYTLGGFGLLIFSFSMITTGAFLLAYLRTPSTARPYIAGFTLLLGAVATAPTWGVRPQMVSLLFTSLFILLLDRFQSEGNIKYILPLPLITLVWVNIHAGYFLGLAIVVIYIGGIFCELLQKKIRKNNPPGAPSLKSIVALCAVLGASVFATLANPNGFHILLYPFQTLNSQAMQHLIIEWFSPDFHQMEWQPLAWFILAFIGAGMLAKRPIAPTKIILTLVFGYAALRSMRFVPLFVIAAVPILVEQLDAFVRVKSNIQSPNRLARWVIPIMLVGALCVVGFRFVQVVQGQSTTENESFPKAAADWIVENHPTGNLFNSYGWGGYLIWRLYPQHRIYIDGRADVYGDAFLYSYLNIYRALPGWEQALNSQAVRLVLVDPDSQLANAISQSSGWEIVYSDKISVIYEQK